MINKAKNFAQKAHKGQLRKNSGLPYITHPIRVAERLHEAGCSKELICAGYLHDVVEDTTISLEDIKVEFGSKVAALVAAHTEDKSKSWMERKQHTIHAVKTDNKEVKYLIVADKLDNILSLETDLKEQGAVIWDHFNAGVDKQKWYYESIAKHMYHGLPTEEVPNYFRTYEKAVRRVFQKK